VSDLAIDAIILTGAAIPATLFVILYWVFAPWYRSEAGRASWSTMFALAALLDVSLAAYWFHWTIGELVARIIYVLIFAACWMKFGALLHEQVLGRHDDD